MHTHQQAGLRIATCGLLVLAFAASAEDGIATGAAQAPVLVLESPDANAVAPASATAASIGWTERHRSFSWSASAVASTWITTFCPGSRCARRA